MLLLILRLHLDVGRGHAVLPDFFSGKLPARNLQSAKLRAQMLNRAAGIDQGPEGHVAANAGKTVKIRQFHGRTAERWDYKPELSLRRIQIDTIGAGMYCQTAFRTSLFDPRRGHLLYWRDSNQVLDHLEDACIRH